MALPCVVGVPQHQQQGIPLHTKKVEGGLLSRLFGSLPGGRRASSSASSRSGAGPGLVSDWHAAGLQAHYAFQQSNSTACAAVGNSSAECASAPFLNYQTGIEAKYSFESELGKGGNGIVRVVVNRETGEEFACKSIKKVLTDASEKKKQGHLDSIRREVQVLTKLKGSLNIVKLEDVYEDEEHVHIIMEMCKGGELWHRIGDRHYSERTVASFMRAVLRTLAQCHAQNILHRDVKPGNFMLLSSDDRAPVKAIDFGLAAPFDPEQLPRSDLGLEGTPWYMAPETLRGDWLPASDIWAAGVMAFQLLCGRFPFDDAKNVYAPAITAIWRSVLNDPLDFDKSWWSGISPEAKDFCRMLLHRDASARPSAKEALKHPWLRGDSSERSVGKRISQSVVARIQRFALGSHLKRTVLQSIAAELLSQPHLLPRAYRDRTPTTASGRPIVVAPDAACLEPLMMQLRLSGSPSGDEGEGGGGEGGGGEGGGERVLREGQLRDALCRMGFRLHPCEVSRLMDQVDLEGRGEVGRAAFAASQMDWRHLQQNHAELWLELAAKAFRSLDCDGSGVLEVDELLEALRARLPPDEVQTALELALQEAAGPGGAAVGETAPGGLDFNAFVKLLKVGSLDSLDLYDDRMSVRSGGSLHGAGGGSVDRYNAMLAGSASIRTGDSSRHGPGSSRHDGAHVYDSSVHSHASDRSDVTALQDNDRSMHGSGHGGSGHGGGGSGRSGGYPYGSLQLAAAPGAIAFRFDDDRTDKSVKGGKDAVRSMYTIGSGGGGALGAGSGMVWRFDVAGQTAPPPPPPPPVWRFDVAGGGKTGWDQSSIESEVSVAGTSGTATGASCRQASAAVVGAALGGGGAVTRAAGGGHYDRRMHGSNLYRNMALKALQATGAPHRSCLDTVAE